MNSDLDYNYFSQYNPCWYSDAADFSNQVHSKGNAPYASHLQKEVPTVFYLIHFNRHDFLYIWRFTKEGTRLRFWNPGCIYPGDQRLVCPNPRIKNYHQYSILVQIILSQYLSIIKIKSPLLIYCYWKQDSSIIMNLIYN